MTLSPKLKSKSPVSEEALIRKGGSSGQETLVNPTNNDQEVKRVNLRIPAKYLYCVDQSLTRRLGNVSRNTWIIEAIVEKLGKEKNASEVNPTSSQP